MDWYGNIIAECVVVEDVDAEEENDVDEPPSYWNLVRPEEEWRSGPIKLRYIPSDCNE